MGLKDHRAMMEKLAPTDLWEQQELMEPAEVKDLKDLKESPVREVHLEGGALVAQELLESTETRKVLDLRLLVSELKEKFSEQELSSTTRRVQLDLPDFPV